MIEGDTLATLSERAISVRLDERAQRALDELVASGLSQSEAIRHALVQTASHRRAELLREESRRVAADPEDRRIKAELLEFMGEPSDAW